MVIHDYYPVHTSIAVKSSFKNKLNIVFLDDWPRKFGDLMPLEKVWGHLVSKINGLDVPISTKSQLWEELSNIWSNEINQQFVEQLVNNIPNELRNVVQREDY